MLMMFRPGLTLNLISGEATSEVQMEYVVRKVVFTRLVGLRMRRNVQCPHIN
jgi:hypothetical protein